jgi:hypothetical protein
MLIQVLGFGSSWWARFGRDPQDHYRFSRHAAYFNSTGLHCGSKLRRYWVIPGLLRFNGNGSFDPACPDQSIGKIFECEGPSDSFTHRNRLLFIRRVSENREPDYYLVVVSSDRHGRIDFAQPEWKSKMVVGLAVSLYRDKSEAMLLMKIGDCIRSSLGIWRLENVFGEAQLSLHN